MEATKIYRAREPWAYERRDVDWRPSAAPAWQSFGLCHQADPDLWFPELGDNGAEAKKTCGMCPVRNLCLEWALDLAPDEHGIIAGLGPKSRAKLRKERQAVAA